MDAGSILLGFRLMALVALGGRQLYSLMVGLLNTGVAVHAVLLGMNGLLELIEGEGGGDRLSLLDLGVGMAR
jgi:hypothetical protein